MEGQKIYLNTRSKLVRGIEIKNNRVKDLEKKQLSKSETDEMNYLIALIDGQITVIETLDIAFGLEKDDLQPIWNYIQSIIS